MGGTWTRNVPGASCHHCAYGFIHSIGPGCLGSLCCSETKDCQNHSGSSMVHLAFSSVHASSNSASKFQQQPVYTVCMCPGKGVLSSSPDCQGLDLGSIQTCIACTADTKNSGTQLPGSQIGSTSWERPWGGADGPK